jgi:hypothetical protein
MGCGSDGRVDVRTCGSDCLLMRDPAGCAVIPKLSDLAFVMAPGEADSSSVIALTVRPTLVVRCEPQSVKDCAEGNSEICKKIEIRISHN